jgi:1-acyl-sn-glycerol-3-phosphate acyltransferase
MKRFLYKIIFIKIWGWKITSQPPPGLKKYVFIVAPHSTNLDFFVGVFSRGILGFNAGFLAKSNLFKPPLGWALRLMGGYPVVRSKRTRLVDQVAELYAKHDRFAIAIAPEGTRKKVIEWKTGFYYIALTANVPVLPVVFDWGKKEVTFASPFYPSGNLEEDLPKIKAVFKSAKGKHGETV